MSIIHRTWLKPTKLEFLTSWLPTRAWYQGGTAAPQLAKAGGFRLDDPEGEVGIEFFVATDAEGPHAYLVPLTYRSAPLSGADHALITTLEHGVLGERWAYDGVHDPVLTGALAAFLQGRLPAQAQSTSDALDEEVTHAYAGGAPLLAGEVTVTETADGTTLTTPGGPAVRFNRLLTAVPDVPPADALGHVTGAWSDLEGNRVRGVFAVVEARA
ncbi:MULTISPECIES: 1,4-alpha-glucan branching protein [unclassified Streptomyces]|uniref:maltokinase N-terminal cap-like domain-containing protein n=1 Tax=unclassified Streptomyces TaxID=2593676 RepID=UPI000DD61CA7|nr:MULTISPECIES: 1,4-alpha-glucan branching protein [unclassified Streptomyces]QZZ32367.1 1,4-alpha-glucan branching protein [Streptomyces sp. ST1015]